MKHINTLKESNIDFTYINSSLANKSDLELYKSSLNLIHSNVYFDTHKPFKMFNVYKFFINEIKKREFDLIHIHDFFLYLLIPNIKKHKKCRIVIDRHESIESIDSLYAKIFTYLERKYLKYIDGTVYVAESQLDYIKKNEFRNFRYIPNYQSYLQFNGMESSIGSVEKKNRKMVNYVYIGSLSTKDRNILLLLKCAELILSRTDSSVFKIGGDGANEEVMIEINKLIERFPSQFHFLGRIPYSKVIDITRDSDFGFLFFKNVKNTWYSSPNKMYEYLLAGCIFVGVGLFTLHNEIIKNDCGLIFPFETKASEIVDKILEINSDPTQRQRMKSNSKELGKKYTWEEVSQRYIELYKYIIGMSNL